jgi:hypothetical protein
LNNIAVASFFNHLRSNKWIAKFRNLHLCYYQRNNNEDRSHPQPVSCKQQASNTQKDRNYPNKYQRWLFIHYFEESKDFHKSGSHTTPELQRLARATTNKAHSRVFASVAIALGSVIAVPSRSLVAMKSVPHRGSGGSRSRNTSHDEG